MATVRKRKYKSGKEVWFADFIVRGKRYRPVIEAKNKAQAVKMARKLEDDIVNRKYDLVDKYKPINLEELSERYIGFAKENKKSWDRDIVSLKNILNMEIDNRRLGDMDIQEITTQHIQKYQVRRKRELDDKFEKKGISEKERNYATINRELACLKHIMYMAIDWTFLEKNPVVSKSIKFYKDKRRDRILSKEEMRELLSASSDHTYQIICFGLNTGMRLGEILKLTWEQVDTTKKAIHVTFTKNDVDRDVPINEFLGDVIKTINKKKDFLFLNSDTGKPLTTIQKSFISALKKAEINGFRFHDLRHTFSSYLAMGGIDEVTRAELLGHSKRTMTMTYSHSNWERKVDAVKIMGELCHVFVTQGENDEIIDGVST
jgi:integrase